MTRRDKQWKIYQEKYNQRSKTHALKPKLNRTQFEIAMTNSRIQGTANPIRSLITEQQILSAKQAKALRPVLEAKEGRKITAKEIKRLTTITEAELQAAIGFYDGERGS